jgi:lipopolysaccharide biosynthesis glycosyltransferase
MESVVIALASNERYFPGLYCALASALSHLDPAREADVRVLDGGLSQSSREVLSRFVRRFGGNVRIEFVSIDESIFRDATLGPGQSHMTYCRILLPHLVNVPRLIYLDCDSLVFRDLSKLFDLELALGKVLAAVRDSETLSLSDDSQVLAKAMNLPPEGVYFNCGAVLMNLDELRRQRFFESAVDFLNRWSGEYRFWDQSAINFLLYGQIHDLPEHWNRASWRFDAQQNNDLDCVLHYTTSAPWIVETAGPAQALFERFAADAGSPVIRQMADFKKSRRQRFVRSVLAPFRALAFPLASLFYKIAGQNEKCAAYQKSAHYWVYYIFNAQRRRRLHRQRAEQIRDMKFKFPAFESAT